jgi:hypothetical protein
VGCACNDDDIKLDNNKAFDTVNNVDNLCSTSPFIINSLK